MKLGYKIDENGKECLSTSIISTRIRELDVDLYINVNRDLSYPLSSPHNQGYHVKVVGKREAFRTEFNLNDVNTEEQLVAAINDKFNSQDEFVRIGNGKSGETFDYETKVYNKTAIDKKAYADWDDDLEDLEDNADQVISVFLNDHLRWEVR